MDTYYISKGKRQIKLHKKERRWGIEKKEREIALDIMIWLDYSFFTHSFAHFMNEWRKEWVGMAGKGRDATITPPILFYSHHNHCCGGGDYCGDGVSPPTLNLFCTRVGSLWWLWWGVMWCISPCFLVVEVVVVWHGFVPPYLLVLFASFL